MSANQEKVKFSQSSRVTKNGAKKTFDDRSYLNIKISGCSFLGFSDSEKSLVGCRVVCSSTRSQTMKKVYFHIVDGNRDRPLLV